MNRRDELTTALRSTLGTHRHHLNTPLWNVTIRRWDPTAEDAGPSTDLGEYDNEGLALERAHLVPVLPDSHVEIEPGSWERERLEPGVWTATWTPADPDGAGIIRLWPNLDTGTWEVER